MALNSTSVIKIVDLLCEGTIEGIIDGGKNVYLDETPILDSNGESNFEEGHVEWDFRLGTSSHGRLTGFNPREGSQTQNANITTVNVEVGANYKEKTNEEGEVTDDISLIASDTKEVGRNYGGGYVVRQITDTSVRGFQLLISIPALFSTAEEGLAKGQLFSATVNLEVYVQEQGGSYEKVWDSDPYGIKGISTTDYQIKTAFRSLNAGKGPWNIKLVKVAKGEEDFEIGWESFEEVSQQTPLADHRGNRVFWSSLIEIEPLYNIYNYSAVVGLALSTKQFSQLPTRSYLIKGIKTLIPDNAMVRDDGSLEFIEGMEFTGTLKGPVWNTCPVCAFYDLLVNKRYGAGEFIDATNINWIDLYPLAQYANWLITNRDGTKEPRFAINTVIGDQEDAYNVIQDLASVFRGMTYWASNTINPTADHGQLDGSDTTPVHLYTNSNVVDGSFTYSGTSLKTRSTSLKIRYNDPTNFYKSNE